MNISKVFKDVFSKTPYIIQILPKSEFVPLQFMNLPTLGCLLNLCYKATCLAFAMFGFISGPK